MSKQDCIMSFDHTYRRDCHGPFFGFAECAECGVQTTYTQHVYIVYLQDPDVYAYMEIRS